MKKEDNELNESKQQVVLENVIKNVMKIPGFKVDRNSFLRKTFSNYNNVEKIIKDGPVDAGISQKTLKKIANELILNRTTKSSAASFVMGIPGGLAMAATVPADIVQFYGMTLKLAQELTYLYGAKDLWQDESVDNTIIENKLILYCGVMFGVSEAIACVRLLSSKLAKSLIKQISRKALTKTIYYPIIKKVCKIVGIKLTKEIFAKGVGKAIPIIGGFASGGITFLSMRPMANKLLDTLEDSAFDYSQYEMEEDKEIIISASEMIDDEQIEESDTVNKIETQQSNDYYNEIIKLKELLDIGVITQAEFEQKKKQILGL
ncbi:MAG: SHOCT domain-containing protein [Christensenellales bacterium]